MTKVIYSVLFTLAISTDAFLLQAWQPNTPDKKSDPYDTIYTNVDGKGVLLVLKFNAGISHNYPTMAVWIEDLEGNYLEPLFVTKAVATGVYAHGSTENGVWKNEPGEVRRPATLPYFLHKRNIKASDSTYLPTPKNPIPDAYTGATPKASFNLHAKSSQPLTGKKRLLFEVNQPWDWNEYWNNKKFPNDFNYTTSCQPALVYAVTIDFENPMDYYMLNPIGHSHYSGTSGLLYTDLTTLSTAKSIFESICVKIVP